MRNSCLRLQWRSNGSGGQVGACALGRISTLFAVILPQTPALLFPFAISTLSSLFHVLNVSYYPLKEAK